MLFVFSLLSVAASFVFSKRNYDVFAGLLNQYKTGLDINQAKIVFKHEQTFWPVGIVYFS